MPTTRRALLSVSAAGLALILGACTPGSGPTEETASDARNVEETQAIVLLRGLPTLDTSHSIAIVELDPEADNFGEILHEYEYSGFDLPLLSGTWWEFGSM